LKLVKDQKGQIIPLVAGILFLIVVLALFSISMSFMAIEQTNEQAAADASSLAAANTLAKTIQDIKTIDEVIFARNATVAVLYLAASSAAASSLETSPTETRDFFAIPAKFEHDTEAAVGILEELQSQLRDAGSAFAVRNGIDYASANNSVGISVPFPIDFSSPEKSARQVYLEAKIKERLTINLPQVARDEVKYKKELEQRKLLLKQEGKTDQQIAEDLEVQHLKQKLREAYGSQGGNTAWLHRNQRELESLRAKTSLVNLGRDGFISLAYRLFSSLPFDFYSQESGSYNFAVAAAKAENEIASRAVDRLTIEKLFSSVPILQQDGAAYRWILVAVDIVNGDIQSLRSCEAISFALPFLNKIRLSLGLTSLSITEVQPALTSTSEVVKGQLAGFLANFADQVGSLISQAEDVRQRMGGKWLRIEFSFPE
jgi:hypothetical protein